MSWKIRQSIRGKSGRARWRLARGRNVVIASISAALFLVMAACSGGGGTSGTPDDGSADSGPVNLTYGSWDINEKPLIEKQIAAFHKTHPNINVTVQVTAPTSTYWTKMKTSTTAGTAPDVFTMNAWMLNYFASNGGLLELSDKFAGTDIDMNNYLDSMTKAFTYDGKVWGMPKNISSFALCYNKKLFKEAGVAFPDDSWTWDNVISAAQKITDAKKGIYGIAATNATTTSWYLTVPQSDGYILSPDGKTSGYDQPGTIQGIQFWTDLINKYHVSPTLQQMTDTPAEDLFTAGKIGMFYCGSWEPLEFSDVPYAKANVDMAPLPKGPNGTRKFYSNGQAIVIAAKTQHPKEAWEFVQFLGSKEAAEILADTGVNVVSYKGAAEGFAKAYPEFNTQVYLDALADSLQYPASIDTKAWEDTTTQDLIPAWTGQSSVEDAAHKAAEDMNKLLAAEPGH